MSLWVSAGWGLQAAGPSSLYTVLLGPDHRPQDELQGMEHSPRHVSIVYLVLSAALSNHISVRLVAKKPWCGSWLYLFHRGQASMFCCLSNFLRFQSTELKHSQSSFCLSIWKDEVPCLFKNVISQCFHIVSPPPAQYFETDDQEFYKTKVCFILNNDVSEMDLVFAEEKYSKSGQLEKVRQRFGKEHPPFFFLLLMSLLRR